MIQITTVFYDKIMGLRGIESNQYETALSVMNKRSERNAMWIRTTLFQQNASSRTRDPVMKNEWTRADAISPWVV